MREKKEIVAKLEKVLLDAMEFVKNEVILSTCMVVYKKG